jgi:hypothetical protein
VEREPVTRGLCCLIAGARHPEMPASRWSSCSSPSSSAPHRRSRGRGDDHGAQRRRQSTAEQVGRLDRRGLISSFLVRDASRPAPPTRDGASRHHVGTLGVTTMRRPGLLAAPSRPFLIRFSWIDAPTARGPSSCTTRSTAPPAC